MPDPAVRAAGNEGVVDTRLGGGCDVVAKTAEHPKEKRHRDQSQCSPRQPHPVGKTYLRPSHPGLVDQKKEQAGEAGDARDHKKQSNPACIPTTVDRPTGAIRLATKIDADGQADDHHHQQDPPVEALAEHLTVNS